MSEQWKVHRLQGRKEHPQRCPRTEKGYTNETKKIEDFITSTYNFVEGTICSHPYAAAGGIPGQRPTILETIVESK